MSMTTIPARTGLTTDLNEEARLGLGTRLKRAAGVAALALVVLFPNMGIAQARGPEGIADTAERVMDAVVNIKASQKQAQRSVPMPQMPPARRLKICSMISSTAGVRVVRVVRVRSSRTSALRLSVRAL